MYRGQLGSFAADKAAKQDGSYWRRGEGSAKFPIGGGRNVIQPSDQAEKPTSSAV